MAKTKLDKLGEETIVENIVQANKVYHQDNSSKIYKLFRETLDLATLIEWSKQ